MLLTVCGRRREEKNNDGVPASPARNSAAATPVVEQGSLRGRSEGGPRRRNSPYHRFQRATGQVVSLRGKQKFLLFACPVASRRLCYGARPSLKVFQNSAFGFSLKKVRISFSVRSQSFLIRTLDSPGNLLTSF